MSCTLDCVGSVDNNSDFGWCQALPCQGGDRSAARTRFSVHCACSERWFQTHQRGRCASVVEQHATVRSDGQVRATVLSGQVTVLPLESYLLHPRSAKLHRVASTLQLNAINARAAADQNHYESFLASVRTQLRRDSSHDVIVRTFTSLVATPTRVQLTQCASQEVLALLVTRCQWPPPMVEAPLGVDDPSVDIVQIVVDWVTDKAARCMALPPWPAALLAAKHSAFAAVYVPYLLHSGFLEPGWCPCWSCCLRWSLQRSHRPPYRPENSFAHRVATLVTQSERLATIVNSGLAQIDPLALSKLLPGVVHPSSTRPWQ